MKSLALFLVCISGFFTIEICGQSEVCNRPSPEDVSNSADAIFIGKIISEVEIPKELQVQPTSNDGQIVGYRVNIERVLKGSIRRTATIFTYLVKSPFSFPQGSKNPADKNRTYLIYAHREKALADSLLTSWCEGSQDVSGAGYYLAFFGIGERLKETKNVVLSKRPAPPESIKAFRNFFNYVKKTKPDIVEDLDAQKRWLSKKLSKSLMDYASSSGSPPENPGYPSNSLFLGVWNDPTTYSIVDTRYYEYANRDNPNARRVMIDILYVWGHEETLDNQYPGVRNVRTFYFVFEDGAWKLEDIYGADDEFTRAESLLQFLRRK